MITPLKKSIKTINNIDLYLYGLFVLSLCDLCVFIVTTGNQRHVYVKSFLSFLYFGL